jgi:NADH-quinone oxidoreductase subunit M
LLLTLTVALPLLGALLVLAIGRGEGREKLVRWIALGASLATLALALMLWWWFDPSTADYQFVERRQWMPAFGISYHVGLDGISLMLVVLTAFLTPIALLSSWESVHKKVMAFTLFMLLLEASMIGVFIAVDLFLFYIFWDAMLIPMYFLIGVWGYDRRVYAAVKFILYTMAGSILMLLAIIGLAYAYADVAGAPSFDLLDLYTLDLPENVQFWFFLAFALAFAIKVPLFPFHTWLPDAHVEAPTAGSIILAGVLLKMGTYGLMRFNLPFFPDISQKAAPYVMALAVVGIIYGALVAMVQPDMKKLVAYSSVSHLGFVVLGIFSFTDLAMQGALYQMLAHGVSTGALFLCVGIVYERRHTRMIAEYGGIATPMPQYSTMFLIIALSSLGLPLLNGFIGEFLILLGAFASPVAHAKLFAVLGASGVILSAVYLLWMLQRVIFGEVKMRENAELEDLNAREKWALVPLVAMAIVMGVAPMLFLRVSEKSVSDVRQRVVGAGEKSVGSVR